MRELSEIGHKIIWLEEVDSTNTYAKNLAEKGEVEGTLVVAKRQTQGRGREDRRWISPEGGLYLSFILRPAFPVKESSLITLLSALAVVEAIEEITPLKGGVKWPNDILIQGKKVGGILTESKVEEEKMVYVVVGIGLNVNNDLKEFKADLLYPATSLKEELGQEVEPFGLLNKILQNLNKYYQLPLHQGWSHILKKWQEKLYQVAERVRKGTGEGEFNDIYERICKQDFATEEKEEGGLV